MKPTTNIIRSDLLLTVAVALLSTVHAFEIPEQYKKPAKLLHNVCVTESGASEAHLRQCLDGIMPDDPAVKCYIHCLFDKIDLIEEETGHIMVDRLLPLIPDGVKELVTHLSRECSHIGTPNKCETAYQTVKCYFQAHDEMIKFCHLMVTD